ncbi:MAG TPA: hypothetical protein VMS37_32835 [Verrucomicrobiae bacterium]|nr:hypothetical protein [Verrucomicrobiae bacterium]
MASPALEPKSCTLKVNLFSGSRMPLAPGGNILLTVRNGNQQNVNLRNNGFVDEPSIDITGLPFFGNAGDDYAVIASGKGYDQAGFFPVKTNPANPAIVDIMLLKKDGGFNFHNASWSLLKQNYPAYAGLLAAGTADDNAAADRYGQLMENRAPVLASYFNLVTAMSQIHLPVKTPLDYIRELIWDDPAHAMAQDRFFGWCDPAMVDQVAQAAAQGQFSAEVGTALFHTGATRSWKQIQFGEANVQLTFHEHDTKTIDGLECVMVEPDIDYYKDLGAHALLEVVTNALTHSLTDPKQVYVLRWMAGRHAGVPNFEPPYTIE